MADRLYAMSWRNTALFIHTSAQRERGGWKGKGELTFNHRLKTRSIPSQPVAAAGQCIPSSRNIPHVESQLHVPGKDIGHHVPPGPPKLVIAIESQPRQVVDAVHHYPYEIVTTANPKPIHVDVVQTPVKWIVGIYSRTCVCLGGGGRGDRLMRENTKK